MSEQLRGPFEKFVDSFENETVTTSPQGQGLATDILRGIKILVTLPRPITFCDPSP
jgi:hypothetical protein